MNKESKAQVSSILEKNGIGADMMFTNVRAVAFNCEGEDRYEAPNHFLGDLCVMADFQFSDMGGGDSHVFYVLEDGEFAREVCDIDPLEGWDWDDPDYKEAVRMLMEAGYLIFPCIEDKGALQAHTQKGAEELLRWAKEDLRSSKEWLENTLKDEGNEDRLRKRVNWFETMHLPAACESVGEVYMNNMEWLS